MHVFSQVVPYNGPLELENVVSFGRKFITPYVIPMDEQKWYQYEELKLTERDPLFIIFTDQPKKTEFELSCAIFDRVNCAISDSQELANYLDVPFPSYSIIRRFPGEAETVVAPFGVEEVNVMDDLLIFLQKNSFPAVVEFSEDNKDLLFSSDRPGFSTHVIFPMDLSDADGLSILEIARKLAKDFFGKCIFASIDLSVKSRYVTNLLLELQIDKLDPPLALMVRSHGEAIRFFRLEYDYDAVESGGYDAMIKNWLASIFTGEITAERFITDSEEISIAATVSEEKNGSNDEL